MLCDGRLVRIETIENQRRKQSQSAREGKPRDAKQNGRNVPGNSRPAKIFGDGYFLSNLDLKCQSAVISRNGFLCLRGKRIDHGDQSQRIEPMLAAEEWS